MALNFTQGLYSGQSRQFADQKYSAADAFKPLGAAIKDVQDRKKARLDTHKAMRKQINEISSVKMWDGRYEEISAKAKLLSDPAQLDEMMKTERGMLQFEQMAKQINDEITLAEDEWAKTHGSPDDPITAATYEAKLQRDMVPDENAYEDSGFEEQLTPEQAREIYDRKQSASFSNMRIEDGQFVFEDSNNGQTIRGVRPIEENPFDPKLTESDVSGFSFFRKRDDGAFDDAVEVEQFVRNQAKENTKFGMQALRHYAEKNGLDPEVVMQSPDQYYQKAEDLWVEEAKDAWNKGGTTAQTAAQLKRQDAMADARRQRSLFMDSIKVIDTPTTTAKQNPVTFNQESVETTSREMFVPLNEIKGSMAVNLGTEAGQLIPQGLRRLPNGTYQITGAFSSTDKNSNVAREITTETIVLNPNNLNDMATLTQLFGLANSQLAGGNLSIPLEQILEDPEGAGLSITQGSLADQQAGDFNNLNE